ncbi:hypothetical protein NEFER03_1953 [Nematocida sp. LUAm3]|nr:hypothetical protein NEFER03_1953 [Nematocida sp. LUAm3]KAI5176453.1 hypothetical protein NEFER02_2208 [Nematocida sp. LUAm2]KAI5179329.1 hypothetical protein NEFER01_2173 [Nematocida sp. LUAm1]
MKNCRRKKDCKKSRKPKQGQKASQEEEHTGIGMEEGHVEEDMGKEQETVWREKEEEKGMYGREKEEEKGMYEREEEEAKLLEQVKAKYPDEIKMEPEKDIYTHAGIATIRAKPGEIAKGGNGRAGRGTEEEVRECVQKLLGQGIIRESKSDGRAQTFIKWATGPDKEEKPRPVSNIAPLSKAAESDSYEIPEMKDIAERTQGSKNMALIDMEDGYHQISLGEEDRHKTAFKPNGDAYEYTRLPMGHKSAPRVYQRMADEMLREERSTGEVAVYMDGVIICTKTEEENMELLWRVMEKIKKHKLRVNVKKMRICRSRIKLLGVIVDGEARQPVEMKRNGALGYPQPKQQKRWKHTLETWDTVESSYQNTQY